MGRRISGSHDRTLHYVYLTLSDFDVIIRPTMSHEVADGTDEVGRCGISQDAVERAQGTGLVRCMRQGTCWTRKVHVPSVPWTSTPLRGTMATPSQEASEGRRALPAMPQQNS